MKTKILMAALLLSFTCSLKAQMWGYVFPPKLITVDLNPTSISSFGPPSSYFQSTGIFDVNGNARFYILNDQVYDGSHVNVGLLPTVPGHSQYNAELVIVPMPGNCDKYYVFYSLNHGPMSQGEVVAYVIIDCTGGSVGVSAVSVVCGNVGGVGGGLAASKMVGSGSSAFFYIYNVYVKTSGGTGVRVFQVTSAGIGTVTDIGYTPSVVATGPIELELSEDGRWLAWSGYASNKVIAINLASPTQFASEKTFSFANCIGLEFVTINNSTTPDLFVCGPGFFSQINLSNSSVTSLVQKMGQYNFDNTMLEYTQSKMLAGFCTYQGLPYFVEYDPVLKTAKGKPAGVSPTSLKGHLMNQLIFQKSVNIYYMPDQIDGADYYNFSTIPFVTLYGVTLNGGSVSTQCGNWTKVYNCAPINISTLLWNGTAIEGYACEAVINIQAYDVNCTKLNSPIDFYYDGVVTLGEVGNLINHDLRNHQDAAGNSLNTKPGYYGITVTIRDCCGRESSQTIFLEVLPTPNINLGIYDPAVAGYVPVSHNAQAPVNVGALSIGFQVGQFTNHPNNNLPMNIMVTEFSANSTALIVNEDQSVNLPVNVPLNSLCVPLSAWGTMQGNVTCNVNSPSSYNGYIDYFKLNNVNVLGNTYKVAVTFPGIGCNPVTEWSYVYISNHRARLATGLDQDNSTLQNASVFPNPASGELTIQLDITAADVFNFELFDVLGRKVATILTDKVLTPGTHNIKQNIETLENGSYFWKVTSSSFNKSGTVFISK